MRPETKYARVGGDRIADQVLGAGPPDLVMTTGNYSHVDMVWEDPGMARFLRTLASFSRLIVFDRRGTGASAPRPLASLPPWESYAQDLTAVLDEVGSEQTGCYRGAGDGGSRTRRDPRLQDRARPRCRIRRHLGGSAACTC